MNNTKINSTNINSEIEEYLSSRYSFKANAVTGRIEYKTINDLKYVEVTEYFFNSIYRDIKNEGIKITIPTLRALLNSDFVKKYNPFIEYINSLPTWDGTTDYIDVLADTITTPNTALWKRCLKKWLVAAVGSMIKDDVVNHTVIIFSGKQGLGKTQWFLKLIPNELKGYYFSGTINTSIKDTLIQLSECFLINMDELENLNKGELGSLKALITQPNIRIRRPYGFSAENLPRRASFAGSVNGKEFLSDTTGNRRFLCFETEKIDYQHTLNMNLVFAQAYSLFISGFQYWFNEDEIIEINSNNEMYRKQTIEEELLLKYFEPCAKEDADFEISNLDILKLINETERIPITNAASYALGRVLSARQFQRYKKAGRYVYALKKKSAPSVIEVAAKEAVAA